jgi:signal transduction histidine kinase
VKTDQGIWAGWRQVRHPAQQPARVITLTGMEGGPASQRSAEEQAERVASVIFLASRVGQLAFSTVMVINDRKRHTRPVLQAAVLAGTWLESGWLARRIVRAGRYDDPPGMWADTLTASGALLISQRGMGDGGAAWPKNIAIGAALGASGARSNERAAAIMGTLCAAAVGSGLRARGREAHVAGLALAVNDAVNWTGMHLASRVYLNAHRRYGRLRDDADALTVERAAAAASEAERSRQHEQLHRITIDVLDRIAASGELAGAVSVARAEAARLRYALRTGGRVAVGLDQALTEIALEARALGMTAELVTAELDASPDPWITEALRAATRTALLAAHEHGGAHRAVVRVATDPVGITVTIRDHGAGFEAGAATDYEARLLALGELLEPHGGAAAVWSEPDSGVRVHLTAPLDSLAGLRGGENSMQGRPDGGLGHPVAGDDNGLVLDRDVDAHFARRHLEGAKHEVGVDRSGRLYAGGESDPFEAGAQQGLGRGNAGRRASVREHVSRVTAPLRSAVGRTAQFDALSAADTRMADRTLLSAVLAWRATGLVTGAASLIAGRSRFRSRPLAVVQLAIATTESAWYARRVLSADRWADRPAAHVDAFTAVALLVLGQLNLNPRDRQTWINWAPWSFAANTMSTQAMGVRSPAQRRLSAAAVVATYAGQASRVGDAIANTVALAGFFRGSRLFADQIRDGAVRLDQARTEAVDEGWHLAEARERSVQLRLLHDHALQTLETIASGRFTDLESVLARARTESQKLADELTDRVANGGSLAQRLTALAAEQSVTGLVIDFDCPQPQALSVVPVTLANALHGAATEAVTNIRKHAGVDQAVVSLRSAPGEVVVTITDQGVGFDPMTVNGGFGMGESISRRMRDVGGSAVVESTPGAGTRITLRAAL